MGTPKAAADQQQAHLRTCQPHPPAAMEQQHRQHAQRGKHKAIEHHVPHAHLVQRQPAEVKARAPQRSGQRAGAVTQKPGAPPSVSALPSHLYCLFGGLVLAAPFFADWRRWRGGEALDRRALTRDLVAIGAPLAAVVALLLAYNALRFGNPLEFGTYYMISGLHPQHQAGSSFAYLPTGTFGSTSWRARR